MTLDRRRLLAAALFGFAPLPLGPARAAEQGVSAGEIVVGQTMPYSGPASAYGTEGKVQAAYFDMINEQGGIGGRKLRLISLDDAYSPPKTIEQVRRLVEGDEVFVLFSPLGTASNMAIRRYLNAKKVPQVFVNSGLGTFGDPKAYPWTIGWQPAYEAEGKIFGRYILDTVPDARLGVLYQNDDFGKAYLAGLKLALGDRYGALVVREEPYAVSDPTVDSQIVNLEAAGADTFVNAATPKFAAQAIRKAGSIGWKPLHFVSYVSASIPTVILPAGAEHAVGVITTQFFADPADPQNAGSAGAKEYFAFMDKYYPAGNKMETINVFAYMMAQTFVQLLRQCGDTLTRENVMRQAANLDLTLPMLLEGVRIRTSPTNFHPIQTLRLGRFDGERFVIFGKAIDAGL
ncbi:ABC transporter substrate-binding protein [Chelatococcus reniformis]|uniref:Branched-chain amino acid ABC transporter substrate-binding protein n=1 Tax=Chelatococcus reniformis TaxID=1494448 RepID=A0A916XBK1_9HYPH|nr:ABC transporter substrate-binding protein [Chelatococcus reniformis]GGC61804.1 branched-chain amino acid ABC transporter substrate-binding protein [Chelatococcus reniformis]